MKKKFAVIFAGTVLSAALALSACGGNGTKIVDVQGQVPALQEVVMGTSDVAFVDYTLAASQCGKGNFSELQIVEGIELSKEEFAVGIRKEDTALKEGINAALVALFQEGKAEELRVQFGKVSIALCNLSDKTAGTIDATIGTGKTLKVGVTDYAPMDFEENGKWTGFDAEMARLVATRLGYEDAEFIEIDWNQKITELKSKKVDVLWNGMTVTEELAQELSFSYSYATNYQVAVIKKSNANKYTSLESMKGAKIVVEGGSAGETEAKKYFGN